MMVLLGSSLDIAVSPTPSHWGGLTIVTAERPETRPSNSSLLAYTAEA